MMVQCAEPTTRGWSQYWSKFSWRTVDWPILSQGWRWRRENDWGEPRWWPFWGFRGRVAIRKRKSMDWDFGDSVDWDKRLHFYVPAWEMPMLLVQAVGRNMLAVNGQLTAMSGVPRSAWGFEPVVLAKEEAAAVVEFMVTSLEVRQNDTLSDLDFDLSLTSGQLWLVRD